MINGKLTPAGPKPISVAWGTMVNAENIGKVYTSTADNLERYRFITIDNGGSLFVQYDIKDNTVKAIEHAKAEVWSKHYFIPTGEEINLTFS